MASNTPTISVASKKRKFSIYSVDQRLILFEVEEVSFSVHEGLLTLYCPGWKDQLGFKNMTRIHDGLHHHIHCARCPHKLHNISPCVFRGFLHWLYYQELPDNDIIRQADYPKVWEEAEEDLKAQPLACRMALALYDFGHRFKFEQLLDAVMIDLFQYFKNRRSEPSFAQVQEIFKGSRFTDDPLQQLCVDLYCKWCTDSDAELEFAKDDFPENFLWRMFKRSCKRNRETLENNYEEPVSMECGDYHYTDSGSDCPCRNLDAGDIFVIR